MDVSNVRTSFLVDGLRFKITLQNIYLIIWNAAMIGTVVVLPYYNRAQPLLCHMPLHPLDTARCTITIQYAAYFDSPISLF